MKVICFGVRDVEKPIFLSHNKYNYELTLRKESLSVDNLPILNGHDAIITRASDKVNQVVLDYIKKIGIKYLLTRTVGYDHIDIDYGHQLQIKMARVPSYSPTAVAEVAFSMALALSRKVGYFAYQSSINNFVIDSFGFAKELKNATVGIIGTGKIGYETAKMFKSLNASILGFDIIKNEFCSQILEYVSLNELLNQSDIVSIHIPYIKGQNDNFINKDFIAKMKDNAILINCARGQLQDEQAILDGLMSNKLMGVGLDVLKNEKNYFNKQNPVIDSPVIAKLLKLYPRVLVTPHIGSYTDEAVANMVEFSFDNLNEFIKTGDCKNRI